MIKFNLLLVTLCTTILLTACGGGGGNSSGGDNSGGDSSGGDNSGGDNSGGDNSGGDNSGGDNSGGDNSGGDNSGSNSPTTVVLLDQTNSYPALSSTITQHLKVTETHQNNDDSRFDLWKYSYSPTQIEKRITFESYESSNLPSAQGQEFYNALSEEEIHEYSPFPITPTQNQRKKTTIGYVGGEAYLSGISYDSLEALVFDNSTPPNLVNSKIKKEPELLQNGIQEGTSFCDEDHVSTGEIYFSVIGSGFWQIGDSVTIVSQNTGPAIQCDENNNPSIVGNYDLTTTATDTLTNYYSVFTLRGRDFHNVLEFTSHQITKSASGEVVLESNSKVYTQYNTGKVAEINTTCFGSVNGASSICNSEDSVATNVPAIPET